MNEDQIRQIAQSVYEQNASTNQFGVSMIPAHTHNGTDSLPIDPNSLTNSALYFAVNQVTLTPAQIKALHTTPVVIVPAIGGNVANTGTNSVIIVEGITAKIYYAGTAYTGANNLEFRYTDASGTKVTADLANTFINSTVNTFAHVAGIITAFTPVFNSPIVVSVPTANPAAGTSSITFFTKYRVISI